MLVATLDRLGEVDEALTVARKACSLDPKLSQAWFNLGELLARREDWKGAQEAFAKLIELRPEDAENHFQLGRCLLHNGDKQGATTLFRKALELQPDRSDIREALEQAERSDG